MAQSGHNVTQQLIKTWLQQLQGSMQLTYTSIIYAGGGVGGGCKPVPCLSRLLQGSGLALGFYMLQDQGPPTLHTVGKQSKHQVVWRFLRCIVQGWRWRWEAQKLEPPPLNPPGLLCVVCDQNQISPYVVAQFPALRPRIVHPSSLNSTITSSRPPVSSSLCWLFTQTKTKLTNQMLMVSFLQF